MPDSHLTTLRDGRDLCWMEQGDPEGWPLLGFHGTPGSRLVLETDESVLAALGLRFVIVDRPGYGLSTFHKGRRLVDWPDDVAQLADHLGIERFSVLGWSGGGPHALVCAALLGDRVVVAGSVAGVAPLGDPALIDGMSRSGKVLFALARRRSPVLSTTFGSQMQIARRFPSRAISLMARQLPDCDAAVVRRPAVRARYELECSRTSRDAGRAASQDFTIFSTAWGFDPATITARVHLWQGDADANVPFVHASVLHRSIPGSVLHECPGEGHYLIVDHAEEILAAMRP